MAAAAAPTPARSVVQHAIFAATSSNFLRIQRIWLTKALFTASAAAATALLVRWRRRHLAALLKPPQDPIPPGILVKTLTEAEATATEFSHFEVSQETLPSWDGEAVIVWHRGADELYATQEACPHASISLLEADIEDYRPCAAGTLVVEGLDGPSIACPAHMFVFDVGSGRCLTNRTCASARIYAVAARRTPTGGADLFVVPTPKPPIAGESAVARDDANAIQLALVDKGLRRRFGDGGDAIGYDA